MNFFHRRKILKRLNFLEATPVRVCKHEESEEGRVSIVVPKFRNPKFNEWFLGKRRSKNFLVKLDKNGSEVWLLIDGSRKVGKICELLEEQNLEEAVNRVTRFLTVLYEQRYITFRELQETDD
jgi:hypothetical protein